MKHHIAVKFIAVILAALSLLCALSSGAGIIALTAADLYENSVDDLYEESMSNTLQSFSVSLAHRYASLHLGELPEQYFNEYWGLDWMYNTFRYGYFYYTIYNDQGDAVESTMGEAPSGGTRYEMTVTNIRYRCLAKFLSQEIPETTAPQVTVPLETQPDTAATQATVPPETQPDTAATQATEATLPAGFQASDGAREQDEEPQLILDSYYDPDKRDIVEFYFTYQTLPPYTVELYLLPGAMPEEYIWTVVQSVWNIRNELFYILGISLLGFAVMAVYLCCAAGKKPGQTEIKAGGLNRIPLDLYGALGGTAIVLAVALFFSFARDLLTHSPNIVVPAAIFIGFMCCLILVGFLFAFAAQVKTPGGVWWRNSLIGYTCRAIWLLSGMFLTLCKQFFPWLSRVLRKLLTLLSKLIKWLCGFSVKIILAAFALLEKGLGRFFRFLSRASRWLGRRMHTFLRMLPLTWQWLLGGFTMLLLMAIVFATNGEEVLVVMCLAACVGLIIYGAHAFGILMEATRRMGKGDLETKVSDQFLIGSFKDFAADLNALADVAVVAAQKQLKSERMKTELITNVSHDIKTPLTSIINYVDLLQKPHDEEEQELFLEVLSRQSQQLKKLIDDLMEMSKASTGNMIVDIISVNAAEAINQALGEFADKLEKAQLIPVFHQPEEPVFMKADGRLVWRVMSNLLSNAVKYALPGTRLYIDLQELDGKVIISMKNISREELNVSADELMERFVRGDTSRNTEGSGLGLNIAQSLMELQKGKLQLLVDGDLFKVTLVFPGVQL